MAKSKRKNDQWSPQAPDQEAAPQPPDESARQQPEEQAPQSPADASRGFDRDSVARRAYDRYLARGGGDGQDLDDWLNAEREAASGTDESDADKDS